MTYRALIMALNILVLIPSLGFVGLFLLTSTKDTFKQLTAISLLVLPASAALLTFRAIFLSLNQSQEARAARDATITLGEQLVSATILFLVAISMWTLLVALIRARKHD